MLDDDYDLDIELACDHEVTPEQLDEARAFFMAMLETAEPDSLRRYHAAEARFHELVEQVKLCTANETVTPEMLAAGRQALDEVTQAKEQLNASMARVAYAMTHTAYA